MRDGMSGRLCWSPSRSSSSSILCWCGSKKQVKVAIPVFLMGSDGSGAHITTWLILFYFSCQTVFLWAITQQLLKETTWRPLTFPSMVRITSESSLTFIWFTNIQSTSYLLHIGFVRCIVYLHHAHIKA